MTLQQSYSAPSIQQEMLRRRLPIVVAVLLLASLTLIVRLLLFQAPQDPDVSAYIQRIRNSLYGTTTQQTALRGIIYDRNGQPLAVNTLLYRIGVSPGLVSNKEAATGRIAAILNMDPLQIREILNRNTQYELLRSNVDPDTWRRIDQLNQLGIKADPIPRRYYPQGKLASQIIGFVGGDGDSFRGYIGVEAFYQDQLAGQSRQHEVSNIPFDIPDDEDRLDRGADLVLTLDRDVQFLAETELQLAIEQYAAQSGTIIIMNPKNGDILAMVSSPSFDPNEYYNIQDPKLLQNAAISAQYEPGSVFKVLTVAAALEKGAITPSWTYNDTPSIRIGERDFPNWNRQGHGVVGVEQVLVDSLNVGAASIALAMGKDDFYSMMVNFGIGRPTRVDLQGEVSGILKIPNVDPNWSESDLGANSFGQGVAVTPLQMLNSVNAIANGGLMMEPRIVKQIIQGDRYLDVEPRLNTRVISAETAQIVTNMMVAVVENGLDDSARLTGYTIAGKTGTAQIPTPIGYEDGASIVTFVGFFPADDPQVSVLIKLDRARNGYWASQSVAPVFRRLAEKLVLMMEIPNDSVRQQLVAQGGVIGDIER